MALSDTEKASVRRWLGYSLLYSQTDPILEGQFHAVDNLPDNGATEALIRLYLVELDAIVADIRDQSRPLADVGAADEASVDAFRGMVAKMREGRMWVSQLAQALNMPVRADAFGTPKITR